jgi:hypothetical protein
MLAWRATWRAVLVRYDQQRAHFLGRLTLACALVWERRLHRVSLVR